MEIACQPERAIADLRALAELTGGPGGARRLCWTDEWENARGLLREALAELPVEVEIDEAGNLWARLAGRAARDRRDRLARRLGAERRLARRRARRHGRARDAALARRRGHAALHRHARRLGRRGGRALRAQPASAPRPWPARSTPTPCATCATRTACGSRTRSPSTASSSTARRRPQRRLRDVRAYLELHIEQGPVLEGSGCRSARCSARSASSATA